MQQTYPIRSFRPVSVLQDTTDKGTDLEQAQNVLLRPAGGWSGPPVYANLWAIGVSETVQTTIRALEYSSTPIGDTEGRRTTNKTVAIQIARQGKNFLLFYDLTADEERACRGFFYLGDDGTYTAGAYAFTTGTPTYTVLAVGLNAASRWYGYLNQGAWFLGNGIDDNVIVQLGRTATPGIWRKSGTNVVPATPVLALTAPSTNANVQASFHLPKQTTFTVNTGTDQLTCTGQIVDSQKLGIASTGTLPSGLISVGTVYAVNASYNRSTNISTFQVALTLLGSAVDITDTGSGTHSLWNYTGSATPQAESLTFTLATNFLKGSYGNMCVTLATTTGSGTGISSTLSGAGTTLDPYIYTLTLPPTDADASVDAVHAFVSADSKILGILSVAKSGSDTATRIDITGSGFLQDGSGTGISEGFSSRTVTIYARYWDPGHDGHGYEGPSSVISNEVIIPNTANNDLSITITPDPTADGGRFPYIRFYMQFGEGVEAVWKLITPDSPTANTSGDKTITVGTDTEFGDDAMFANQNRPLPHKWTAFTAEQTFRAGLIDYPDRLYASKIATADEIAPEGCSLLATDYETVNIPGTPAGSRQVTALLAPEQRLEIHTVSGLVLLDPTDLSQRVYPQSTAGAINGSAVTLYEGKEMYYWAADLQLRSMNVQRPNDFASTVATSNFAAMGALHYLRQHLDPDTVLRSPDRVFVFPDSVSQHIWMFAPGRTDGELLGFAYDLLNKGMVGPFTYPKVYAAARMEPGRPEFAFADEAGRLFIWDTSDQMDSDGNAFGTQSAFTPYSTGTAMPAAYNGYGYVDYDHDQDGTASRFYQATECILETGMIDFNNPARRKAFMAAVWRTIADSRAFVEVTFTNMDGETETFVYGDVNDATACRASLMLPGTACRVKLRIIGAEMKKWAMRDLSVLWAQQGRV
ncbi:MAG: hypothetical protein R3F13_13205 [Prosthecobacter sp.]